MSFKINNLHRSYTLVNYTGIFAVLYLTPEL